MQINKLSYGLDPNFVEPAQITMKVVQGCHNNVTTVELDVSFLKVRAMKLC
jgi:ribonucleoside-diphosphate reductase subunit M1